MRESAWRLFYLQARGNMKNIIAVVIMLLAVSAKATNFAGQRIAKDPQTVAVSGYLINESGLAYSTTYVFDAGPYTTISAQMNIGTATFTTSTFSDGQEGYGHFTFLSTTSLSGVKLQFGPKVFVAGTDYTVSGNISVSQVALNFISSITAMGLFPDILFSSSTPAGVVYATATKNGVAHDYGITSSNYAIVSTNPMTGAVDAAFSSGSAVFSVPSHSFTLGLPVLYSASSAAIGGLTNQATYYVIPIDANNIQLAVTSTSAIAGTGIKVTSITNQAAAHAPTLAPLAIAGSPLYTFTVSNDGTNYIVSTSSSGSAIANTYSGLVDFSDFDYRYLRINVTGPSAGAVKIQAIIHAK